MISFETAFLNATSDSPFSNGTEWDCWSAHWCQKCVHFETCPLIDVALINHTPREWREIDHFSLYHRYQCTEFEEIP